MSQQYPPNEPPPPPPQGPPPEGPPAPSQQWQQPPQQWQQPPQQWQQPPGQQWQQPPPGYPPQPVYGAPAAASPYGGFWIRFVAYFIDALIIAIPTGVIIGIMAGVLGASIAASNANNRAGTAAAAGASGLIVLLYLMALAVTWVYLVYFWSQGATLGMRVFHLRVVDASTGQNITTGKAVLRLVGFYISTFVCYIGLIWAAFDSRKQGWHDKIANTVVVKTA
jgi:uncharacterized RDD family membrane protein YckC